MPTPRRSDPVTGAQARALGMLRRDLSMLEYRYGDPTPPELESLDRSLRRRTARIDHLGDQLDELLDELAALERERAGLMTAMELLVTERIGALRRRHGEAWSPFPVLGYRMWGVVPGGLTGVFETWRSPTNRATCTKLPDNPDVPHTDSRCTTPRCGIYARKGAGWAVEHRSRRDDPWALGLVEMRGKVVEHRHGYRAAQAEVVAIAVTIDGRTLMTDEPDLIELSFTATADTVALFGEPAGAWPLGRTVEVLESTERRYPWTSDPKSG